MRKSKPKSNPKQSGFIRLISGKHKGRKLPVHDVEGLRPTTDRMKETVFNWLMQDVRDAKVLDCFAGAGSLGFEAISRFAAHGTFIELDRKAATQLTANSTLLKLGNVEVINQDALTVLANNPQQQQYDLVFIDPPFRKNLVSPCCALLESSHWLSEEALIYVEFEQDAQPDIPSNWKIKKEKQAGQVICRLYQR
ncbi:16S rRNA (guanine(966)-N(2))-methyltransferase RsmD [Pseudoalteromonas sp. McH1-7]|uniref:Ribosomal RNA small subunit methyltransferase D n=1 Tax=Pseudoalteromonas peptidolytica F12-50-A1 TaxID=1315280 RepID=A0A8I0MSR1_9GAMM|nr:MULTISPECIES: 16S rRNA (guanine(966)-N(2))-methyltransferase RsmD [Pseudoalteromonas]MBE0345129.1 16S rRNA (guanine966-N2)-methyltransferase [Pseudoalteromonas peptidolytica F12-50-A1]MDW7550285.1 16S rRNA (guanine(966)-N(2))-methyltransferase RsmD [Pseudoalteromonas peptidolytica]NLR14875.1 16S rRNA (guanine(966)-N(2))-methyltransferase RsmD [Pseudoalteromonas peptidolytica]NUZ10808.1 16S rRNA (guanine(966)-N(2))-methyltransferase RsmD [Pseudoalteromonas sp. McH1-7]RRS08888.1 16S rRNA (gua